VLREAGMMVTTPNEAWLRADTLLLVGPSLEKEAPDLSRWLGLRSSGEGGAATKPSLVRLCPGRAATIPGDRIVAGEVDRLPVVLAALRARLAGRAVGKTGMRAKKIEEIAALLKAARFGVAVWSAVDLDALAIEMLCGIVADLNRKTRFTGFAIPPGNNAIGVLQACGWVTGFPMRTGFGRGHPEHDPWRHDGARMVAAGEADCVVWISAYRAAAPRWPDGPPVIALTTGEATLGAAVQIEVGQPGVDHDGVELYPPLGTLVAVASTRRSETTSVADAIAAIIAAMPGAQVAA
jgi:formylmethanofuran dehydrogenase subunit B